jgi:hypothetical protein
MDSDIQTMILMMALEYMVAGIEVAGFSLLWNPFCHCEGFEPELLFTKNSTKKFHKQNFDTFLKNGV